MGMAFQARTASGVIAARGLVPHVTSVVRTELRSSRFATSGAIDRPRQASQGLCTQGPRAAALVGALVCRRPVIARASDGKEDSGEGGLSPKGARTEQVIHALQRPVPPRARWDGVGSTTLLLVVRAVTTVRATAPAEASKSTRRSPQVALPIFPLGNVAMPCGSMPLHIFEARYRVLFATLLEGSEGVNTDLVDVESPFKARRGRPGSRAAAYAHVTVRPRSCRRVRGGSACAG